MQVPQRSMTAVHIYCSVHFSTSDSMEVASSTQGGAVSHGIKQAKRNAAFIKKAPQGEWQTLIRAASNLQLTRTGGFQQLPMIVYEYQTKVLIVQASCCTTCQSNYFSIIW